MANSLEEIMMRFTAKDDASGVANSMVGNIKSAISSLDGAMANFGQVTDNVMQGLTGKSAMDNILGTSSKAETNKVLLNNMTETREGAEKLYDTVDKVTDSSLTSMQELIPAMKAFKSATGASDKEMTNITDEMANFGAAVLAQTGSTDLAQQSMMDLSKGIKGAFASLDQYGISQEALERTGLWDGSEEDVEGYMKAVKKVIGSTEELMETNQGLDALIGKAFSRAGKKMGNEFLPQIKDIKRAFLDMDENMGGGLSASILAVSGAVEVANTGFTNVSAIVRGVEDLGTTFNAVKNISKGAKVVEEGIDAASNVGSVAANATAAAVETEATAVATTTLSASFTSMIVPLLAISAVIAIMIPIAAGLAAEALLFLKAIQMVFDALDFGGIDLSDDIDGIKQLAEGLAWVGVAMGAMSFTSVMTGLAVITGGFLGITGPLEIAVDALKTAGKKLSEFNTVHIDESVATTLKNISDSLIAVSSAMGALTWNNIVTGFSDWIAGALGFSSVTEGLEKAKNDIIEASSKLNEFSGMTPLDESVATNIKNVCDSLASVGDAMGALRSIRDNQNWDDMIGGFISGIFGEGVDIQKALLNVKEDIINASQALAQFTGISEIPEDVSTKIKSVGDTLTSVSEAVTSINDLVGSGFDNWVDGLFGGHDVAGGLEKIKTDLIAASQKLSALSGLSEVSEDVTTKLTNVGNALNKLSEVVPTMNEFPPMEGFDSNTVSTAVTNVKTIASQLSTLSGVTLGEDSTGVLGTINTALQTLKDTLSNASGFSEASINVGTQIVTGVQSGVSSLGSTVQGAISSAISSASGSANAGGSSLGTQMNTGFQSTLNLHTVMDTEMGYLKTSIDNGISAAKTAAQNGAKEVVDAFKSGINVGSPGDIARTMSGEMDYTKESILNAYGFLKGASYNAARTIVDAFGKPSLGVSSKFNQNSITGLQTAVSDVPYNGNTNNMTIIISEGAVQVDARNKTEREAQQMFISVLESFKPTGGI